tara:strand:- start:284725 stop:285330 length:606 start_codon:yes stop_codon:yes gene_type:complete
MKRTINGTDIPYTIRISKRSSYARIIANHKGIEVSIPEGTPLTYAEEFAEKKRIWIKNKHQEMSHRQLASTGLIKTEYVNTETAELKRLLKIKIKEIIVRHNETLGRPKQLRIKEQSSRWGSCSSKGGININWKLIFAPDDVLEYVVVHELCHLTHMNHSKKFWDLVGTALPEFRPSRLWLRLHGQTLMSVKSTNNTSYIS